MVLQQVALPVISFSQCQEVFGNGFPINQSYHICTGYEEGRNICNGMICG